MTMFDEFVKRRDERIASRPQSGGDMLWLRDTGTAGSVTMAIAHSLCSGQVGDPFAALYTAHVQEVAGRQRPNLIYCPVESGHDENFNCRFCKEGLPTKDRFAMWLWVYVKLYNQLKNNENYPPRQWSDGNNYFVQDVNQAMLFEVTAWKTGPLNEIQELTRQLGDLRKMRLTVKATGTGFDKTYKVYPDLNSQPLDKAIYDDAIAKIKPVRQWLSDSIESVPVVTAPPPQTNVTPITSFGEAVSTAQPNTSAPPWDAGAPAPTLPPFKAPDKPESLF